MEEGRREEGEEGRERLHAPPSKNTHLLLQYLSLSVVVKWVCGIRKVFIAVLHILTFIHHTGTASEDQLLFCVMMGWEEGVMVRVGGCSGEGVGGCGGGRV